MNLIFRKKNPKRFSIEGIFNNVFENIRQSNSLKCKVVEMPYYSRGFLLVLKNLKFIRKYRNDFNHITGDVHYAVLALPKEKTILTIHDCVTMKKSKNPFKNFIYKKLWYDWPVNRAAYVTTISEKSKTEILSYVSCNPSKIKVIPNCIDPIFQHQPKTFNKAYPTILQIGTKENKNLNRLIQALKGIPSKLCIIGDLNNKQIQELEKFQINYESYKRLTLQELYEKYVASDLVAFVSTYEGFGLPIIESQAVGRAVLTSNIEPMTTVSADASLLVNPYEVISIRKGILELINNDKLRNSLISDGLINASQYSVESVSRKYMELYVSVQNK